METDSSPHEPLGTSPEHQDQICDDEDSRLFELIPPDGGKRGLKSRVHFSSESCEWATPIKFFEFLDAEFGFELDVCATPENAKCPSFYTKREDGLAQPWKGTCWCNPPYGREIIHWLEKAMKTAQAGLGTVVCLVPARTDTKWWHDYVGQASEVRFVKGRLKFGGHANSAPFPSAVVVFRPTKETSVQVSANERQETNGRTIRLDNLMQPELIGGIPATHRLRLTALNTDSSCDRIGP